MKGEELESRRKERVRAIETAQARIDALIARAGSPVMIVKSGERNRFSNHMQEIDGIACAKAKELKILKSNAIIMVLCDEVEMMDDQITDMANTIDRMEAALYNTLNERDQMIKDMKKLVFRHGDCFACKHLTDGMIECCAHCNPKDNQSQWEWRGVQEVKDDDA